MKKSKLLFTLTLTLLLVLALAVSVSAKTRKLGDVDGDSKVTASDARLALRAAVQLNDNLDEISTKAANVDGDQKVTASDARLILRAAVNLEKIDGSLHEHEAAAPVKENVKAATCTAAGTYDEVVRCAECREVLSSTPKTEPALGHLKTIDEAKSTFSLTGDNRLVYSCSRCGKTGNEDATLLYTGKLTSENKQENVDIVNHFINLTKPETAKFRALMHDKTESKVKSSEFEMNNAMKILLKGIGTIAGEDFDLPTDANGWRAMLNDMTKDMNTETKRLSITSDITNENYPLKGTPLSSKIVTEDLKALTVQIVDRSDFLNAVPAKLPGTRLVQLDASGTLWYFSRYLKPVDRYVKVTYALNDENHNSIETLQQGSNLDHIYDLNKSDFKMEDFNSAFDGMEDLNADVNASSSNKINTKGTVTYYFDAETGKPMGAIYDVDIDTENAFSMSITLKTLTRPHFKGAGNITANFRTQNYYIFDPTDMPV